jgi:hypothetical protein
MPKIGDIVKGTDIGRTYTSRLIWSSCKDCGKERWTNCDKGKPESIYCSSCKQRGKRNHNYRGGKYKDAEGYVLVTVEPTNFFHNMVVRGNYIFEHRFVMAQHMKRCLLPWEIVHHKNGIKDDNRIENLQLLPNSSAHISSTHFQKEIVHLQKEIIKWQKLTVFLLQNKKI